MDPEKEITIYDLARELNMSVATISRALKDDPVVSKKTKKKIHDLAEAMGYRSNHFARNLRNKKTHMIGVVIPRVNSYFMSTVIAGIEKVTNEAGYNLIISQSSESAEKEVESVKTMFNNRVDGLLVSLAYDTGDMSHFDLFTRKHIPFLFFDRVAEDNRWTNVLIDNRKAGYEATTHLIRQGCRRIVHVTAPSPRNVYQDRLAGYKQALAENGIPFREAYVIYNNITQEAGAEAADAILAMKERPDGVFAANDNCAVGCLLALKRAGVRIPGDVAIVGVNNDPVSTVVAPNLTTINYPGYEMGVVAARNLVRHLSGQTDIESATILLKAELIVRESSLRGRQAGESSPG